jgi:hypothetical protein
MYQLRDKPTLEQQKIKLQAVQSVGTYYQRKENVDDWDPRGSPLLMVNPAESERINTPWRVSRRPKQRARTRNMSHARIVYVRPTKPVKGIIKKDEKPEWIDHLKLKR